MSATMEELATARDNAKAILDELKLDAYLYEVEPHDDTWEIKVECACDINGGWESIALQVPKRLLLGGFDNEKARNDLFSYWNKKLNECKTRCD